jgi:TP901 family phage tail tape measure protein
VASVGEAFVDIKPNLGNFERELTKGISTSLTKVGDQVSKTGGDLTKKITLPIVGLATGAVAAFTSIDNGISEIGKATGATGSDLAGLGDNLRNVLRNVPEDAKTVGIAIGDLSTRLGLTGSELEGLTKQSLDFARVNKTDVLTATSTVGKLMNALELDASEATSVMDKLTLAAQKSGISAVGLGQNILDARPAFQELGFDLDRSIALFSTFESVGARPEEVIGSLNRALTNMSKNGGKEHEETMKLMSAASEKAAKDAEDLAVAELKLSEMRAKGDKVAQSALLAQEQKVSNLKKSVQDNNKFVAESAKRLEELGDATTDPQKQFELLVQSIKDAPDILAATTIASEAFGARAGAKVAESIRAGRFEVEGFTGEIADASGVVTATAAATETFAERMAKMRNEAALVGEQFGQILLPYLERALGVIRDLIERFNNLSPAQRKLIVVIAAVAAAVGPVLIVVGKLIKIFGTIFKVVGVVIGIVGKLSAGFAFLISPVGLIILGIVALIAIIVIVIKNFDAIKEVISKVASAIGDFISGALEWIKEAFNAVWETVKNVAGGIKDAFVAAFDFLVHFFSSTLSAIAEVFTIAFQAIHDFINAIVDGIKSAITKAFNAIKDFISTVMDTIKEVISAVLDFVLWYWTTILNFILDAVKFVFNAVKDFITTVINTVLTVVTTVLGKIRDVFSRIFKTIRDVVFGVFEKLKDIVVSALSEFFDRFTRGLGRIKDAFVDTFNGIVDFFSGVVSTLARVGGDIFGFIKDSFKGALNFVINGWNSLRFTIPSFGVGPVKFPGFELGVPRIPLLANGAIVTGPMLAGIGEAGPEAVIPISRPARAMQLMEQSGLAAMVRGQGSAVTIQTANFVNGTDADLVAQKVMAAWRGRSAA